MSDTYAIRTRHGNVRICASEDGRKDPHAFPFPVSRLEVKIPILPRYVTVDVRVLIGESGAVSFLVPLLRCSDPWTQEHAVTELLNLSLQEDKKKLIFNAGAMKSLIYVLKTGSALLSLVLVEENKTSIGASGAIPPLVSLLLNGSSRGKKDVLTTLYKLCSVKQNKDRAVSVGAVKPLVELVAERGTGIAEKAMVVLNSLAGIQEGKDAIVEEGGMTALVEAIEDGSVKGKGIGSERHFEPKVMKSKCTRKTTNELKGSLSSQIHTCNIRK